MSARIDHLAIANLVSFEAKVLDVGCGDGELLTLLQTIKSVRGFGLELSQDGVNQSMAKGLMVVQGDAGKDLAVYPDNAFDIAVLSQAIQNMIHPRYVLQELSRIAPEIVVSFQNFGYWQRRIDLALAGKMPTTSAKSWYDSSVVHPCTATDFASLAEQLDLTITQIVILRDQTMHSVSAKALHYVNIFAKGVIFHLKR